MTTGAGRGEGGRGQDDAGREHGCTVVIATHDPFVLDNCDEVVAL